MPCIRAYMHTFQVPYHWRLGSCISSAITLAFKCLEVPSSQKGFFLDGRVFSVPGMAHLYHLFPALASLQLRPQSLAPKTAPHPGAEL